MDDIATPRPVASATSRLDRFFPIAEGGSSVPRELTAGATTFAAMAYILAVNPAIMAGAGMDRGDLVGTTALAAIFGSVMMGLSANLLLAVVPAMGSNVVFTYGVVKQMGPPWQAALAMVANPGRFRQRPSSICIRQQHPRFRNRRHLPQRALSESGAPLARSRDR